MNLKSFNEYQDLIGLNESLIDDRKLALNIVLSFEPVIVFLVSKNVMTYYTSLWTRKLQELIRQGRNSEVRFFINKTVLFADHLIDFSVDFNDVEVLADKLGIEVANAELLLSIKRFLVERKRRLGFTSLLSKN